MFKRIKISISTCAILALLMTNAGVAFAVTFDDVPADAWYYEYVEAGVDQGIFDVADNFNPGDPLNRAQLAKIVITAIDGLADYEAPATPTFDDVPADAWYYDFVEAAVQLGIVAGYTDASGNLTGLYGPSDHVTRAAATKILVTAFDVPTTLSPPSSFSDVPVAAWFHDYVVTAYNQSVLDGYLDGTFGSADLVTRAQVAKLVANAQNPLIRPSEGESEGEDDRYGTMQSPVTSQEFSPYYDIDVYFASHGTCSPYEEGATFTDFAFNASFTDVRFGPSFSPAFKALFHLDDFVVGQFQAHGEGNLTAHDLCPAYETEEDTHQCNVVSGPNPFEPYLEILLNEAYFDYLEEIEEPVPILDQVPFKFNTFFPISAPYTLEWECGDFSKAWVEGYSTPIFTIPLDDLMNGENIIVELPYTYGLEEGEWVITFDTQ